MGEESPGSGSSIFQRTFSVALQDRGTLFSGELPSPLGPRHAGQFAAQSEPAQEKSAAHTARACQGGVGLDNCIGGV
jgi:hypothetical protein